MWVKKRKVYTDTIIKFNEKVAISFPSFDKDYPLYPY